MSTAYVIVTVLAAAMVGFSAVSMFLGAKWVVAPVVGSLALWLTA